MDATWVDTLRLTRRGRRHDVEGWASGTRTGARFVDLPRARLRVRVGGEAPAGGAPTVVFACDPPNVVEHYDALLGLLAPRFRSVCVELPGFGFSTPKRGFGFSLEEYARTVADLLTALGAGPYLLAFPCVWAYAALGVAAERPELVSRLLLVQAPSWAEEVGWSRRIDRRGFIRTPFVGQALMASRPRQVAERWYRAALPRGASGSEEFLGPARRAFEHGACFCLGSFTQAWFGGRAPAFPTPSQPVLAVWGASDRSHGATDRRSILEHVPHAAYLEYEDAGHFPELERAERFVETLGEFAAGA